MNDEIFKPPQRLTRSRSHLFENEKNNKASDKILKVVERPCSPLKTRSKQINYEVPPKSSNNSTVNRVQNRGFKIQPSERGYGVLTRNRSRSLLKKLDFSYDIKNTRHLFKDIVDSGYGTSSDTSKECSESITSESRESLESGFSDPCRSGESCHEDCIHSKNMTLTGDSMVLT